MNALAPGITASSPMVTGFSRIPNALLSPSMVIIAATVAIAIQLLWLPVNADVSWLITVCERVLGGSQIYADIFEVNPPASVWIYLPLVALAQFLGTKPEAVVIAAFVAAAVASIAVTVRLASPLKDAPSPLGLTAILSFAALILPMALFAQREHAALLLALPCIAAIASIGEANPLSRRVHLASGLAAGLMIVIKPHFAAAVIIPALWAVYRRRTFTPIIPAAAAGAVVVLLYAFAILIFAPAYLDYLPTLTATYLPSRPPLLRAIVGPSLYPAICLAVILLLCGRKIPPLTTAWMLGAAGFLLAALLQTKNYPNHWLPQAALMLSAAATVLRLPSVSPGRALGSSIVLATVGLCLIFYWAIRPDPAITKAVRELAPPAPRIIALSPQLTTGHPVTRNIGGTWVGSRAALFTAAGARFVKFKGRVAQEAYREDIRSFLADVELSNPDVVLVDIKSKGWLMAEPEIAQAMAGYAFADSPGDVEIWLRRPGI